MKKKERKNTKFPSCIGNFGIRHNYCIDECLWNTRCEEESSCNNK